MATLASLVATAQTPNLTTLYIDISVERQEIVAGPYARYAQKYLGISAPLADKVIHEVTRANVSDTNELTYSDEYAASEGDFSKLPIDRTSGTTLGAEESARLAAARIFEIRRNRFDLITGNVGENVFGAGLSSALAELDRMEEEYLALFLGKQNRQVTTKKFRITPSRNALTYTLPADNDSGEEVVLELKTLGIPSLEGFGVTDKPSSKSISYTIPADVLCRVLYGDEELASTILPVNQFGRIVYLAQ